MTHVNSCRVLTNAKERAAARAIVRRAYAAQGYDTSDAISRYLEDDSATTFGLFRDDTLYGTISIVIDSADGLPMDAIYTEELSTWRAGRTRIAEVVQFAVDPDQRAGSPFETAPLFAAVLARAIEARVRHLCISINPKHDRFYRMLGFEQVGALKHYGSVDAPAIACAFYVPNWNRHPFVASLVTESGMSTFWLEELGKKGAAKTWRLMRWFLPMRVGQMSQWVLR